MAPPESGRGHGRNHFVLPRYKTGALSRHPSCATDFHRSGHLRPGAPFSSALKSRSPAPTDRAAGPVPTSRRAAVPGRWWPERRAAQPWCRPRSRGDTRSPTIAIDRTISPPAPSPWRKRKPIGPGMFRAGPRSAEPMRKITIAVGKSLSRPYWSPSFPHNGVPAVEARRWAVTTHERWSRPSRSLTIVGSAVAAMVWSSAARERPSGSAPSDSHSVPRVCPARPARPARPGRPGRLRADRRGGPRLGHGRLLAMIRALRTLLGGRTSLRLP